MKVATIFSGGFAGVEWAFKYSKIPHKIVFACEIDKFARKLYTANHKCDTFYEDVKEIDGTKYQGEIDILIGGFPCQAFSIAGQRKGFLDTRGTLFFEFARLLNEIKPSKFIAENVKGLLSHDKGRTWSVIQNTLRELGYHIDYKVLNAKDFNTPQNRERIFIVGFKDADEYHAFSFPPVVELNLRLKDVLELEAHEKYYLSEKMLSGFIATTNKENGYKFIPKTKNQIANAITTRCGLRATDTFVKVAGFINQKTQGSRVFCESGISPTLSAGTKGYNNGYLEQIGYINKNAQGQRVYSADGLSTTQSSNGGGMGAKTGLYKVKSGIRRLTPRECFRLMGDYKDQVSFADLSDTQLYKNAGNGIEIRTMSALLKALLKPKASLLGVAI